PSLISPWMSNGSLPEYITGKDGEERITLMIGVGEGLNHLHSYGIVHGDLKGENVLVSSDGTPCLTDFGLSKILDEHGFTTTAPISGSIRWMAPELLKNEKTTVESDIWAFGMTLLEIVGGRLPYYNRNDPSVIGDLFQSVKPVRPPIGEVSALTNPVWSICELCWDIQPEKRSSITTAISSLRRCLMSAKAIDKEDVSPEISDAGAQQPALGLEPCSGRHTWQKNGPEYRCDRCGLKLRTPNRSPRNPRSVGTLDAWRVMDSWKLNFGLEQDCELS
ncbi:hypothetical protein M422DRAFT_196339, partial [Sphaerobolus stellatus SS14]